MEANPVDESKPWTVPDGSLAKVGSAASSPSVAKGEPTTIADAINLYGTKPAAQPGTMTAREWRKTYPKDGAPNTCNSAGGEDLFWSDQRADALAAEHCRGLEQRVAELEARNARVIQAVTGVCQILDVVKGEWGESWSEFDQAVRNDLSAFLGELYADIDRKAGSDSSSK